MAGHPLRSATDRRLGRPLPHQLANQPQAHPSVRAAFARPLWSPRDAPRGHDLVLAPLSRGYSRLKGRLPTCYSPVRRCTHPLAGTFSLDLHVLGTPPAFVLSQDQTLRDILLSHIETTRTIPSWRTGRNCACVHPQARSNDILLSKNTNGGPLKHPAIYFLEHPGWSRVPRCSGHPQPWESIYIKSRGRCQQPLQFFFKKTPQKTKWRV